MRPCGFPPSITHGYVVSGQTNVDANYQCKVQHEISKSTIQCTSGTWEAPPTCTGKLQVVTPLIWWKDMHDFFVTDCGPTKWVDLFSMWWKFTGFYRQILLDKHKGGLTINIETNIAHQHFLFSVWMGATFEGDRVNAAKLLCSLRHFHCVRTQSVMKNHAYLSTSPDWRPQITANSIVFFKSLFKLTKKKTSKLQLVPLTKSYKTFHDMTSSWYDIICSHFQPNNVLNLRRLQIRWRPPTPVVQRHTFLVRLAMNLSQGLRILAVFSLRHGTQHNPPAKVQSTTHSMMTSSNGNIVRVTGPLCGEFTGHRWITLTQTSDAELWCFLWSAPEKTVE